MVRSMRTGTLIATAAGALALMLPATAVADKEIVAQTGNRFDATTYTMDQGEKLTFRNTDPLVNHDVVSVAPGSVQGRYLFASDTIGQGTSFVEGSQYLTTGEYEFYCSVHAQDMRGKLTVTSAGTPAPRPGTGGVPAADTIPPVPTIKSGKLVASKLIKARKLVLTVGADEASELEINIRVGSKRIAGAKLSLTSAGTQRVEVRLGRTARKSINKGKRLTASVSAADPAGNQGIAKFTKKLG